MGGWGASRVSIGDSPWRVVSTRFAPTHQTGPAARRQPIPHANRDDTPRLARNPKRARPSSGRADARTQFPVHRATTCQLIPHVNRSRGRGGSLDSTRERVTTTPPRLAGDAQRPIIHPQLVPTPYRVRSLGTLHPCHCSFVNMPPDSEHGSTMFSRRGLDGPCRQPSAQSPPPVGVAMISPRIASVVAQAWAQMR